MELFDKMFNPEHSEQSKIFKEKTLIIQEKYWDWFKNQLNHHENGEKKSINDYITIDYFKGYPNVRCSLELPNEIQEELDKAVEESF